MSRPKSQKYLPLPLETPDGGDFTSDDQPDGSECSDTSLLKNTETHSIKSTRSICSPAITVANLVLCVISVTTFSLGLRWQIDANKQCLNLHSAYSPVLKDIDSSYTRVKFNGTIDYPSIFRQAPSPEVDAAWDDLDEMSVTSISEDDVIKAGKTTDSIRISDEFGGGFMASVEVNHQLHCLNFLRKSLHKDYYATDFSDTPEMVATHLGHCVELLRQFVMCHADAGIITFRWVKGYRRPYPDFNTWHQCRNFRNVLQWTKDHQLPEEAYWLPPMPGASILDSPP